jgi:methyl-accepting chemotaxis protein
MNLLSHFTIRAKLTSMVALSTIALCAIIGLSASLSQKRMLQDRIAQLHGAVDMVTGVAQSLQDEVVAGKLSRADAEVQFRTRAGRMMFNNGQGYAAAYRTSDTGVMMNAANPKLEGKVTGATDSTGVVISRAIIDAAMRESGGGTASYLYPRPGQTNPVEKLVYARHFAPWDIVIGVGLYVDDLDDDFRALLIRLAGIGAVVIGLIGLLSWLIARDVVGALDRQKNRMQRIASGSLDQPVEETERGDEIGRMAETLEMLRQTAMTARTLEAEQVKSKQ